MSPLRVDVITDTAQAQALRPEWSALHRSSAERNPFAHPDWLLAWAALEVGPGKLRVMAVRSGSELVGVVPLFIQRSGPVRFLRLLGTGARAELVELPGLLAQAGLARRVVRTAIDRAHEGRCDWDLLELVVAPGQGWLDPQLMRSTGRGSLVVHKGARACVMLRLPETPEAWSASLKRNVRASLSRARNQLDRESIPWQTRVARGPELLERLDTFFALHGARARMPGKVRHPAVFADAPARQFLRTALGDAARREAAELHELQVDGRSVAAQIALHGEGSVQLAWSGIDPGWWHVSVMTLLTAEIIRQAITRGDRWANLSPGPDVAKLRWGEEIESYHELVAVRDTLRARAGFGVFWPLRAVAEVRRESRRHEPVKQP